ncbi:MAG: NTP transferase domain-containing protein [Verrucomicrobiales bacterium]
MSEGNLRGLVLAGGRSRRMGTDKAGLSYRDGKSQIEVVCELLRSQGITSELSLRADQESAAEGADGVIRDGFGDVGPLGAIASAQRKRPESAWLVVACDLPRLDAGTLAALVAARDESAQVSCFKSEHDGRPEPLCAIWEPTSAEVVRAAVTEKKLCARRLLEDDSLVVTELDPVVPGALDNANTPEEAAEIRRALSAEKTVTVSYFGILGARAGRSEEKVSTRAQRLSELYTELSLSRGLQMPLEAVRAALDDEFVDWEEGFAEGAEIGFMPPSCGG